VELYTVKPEMGSALQFAEKLEIRIRARLNRLRKNSLIFFVNLSIVVFRRKSGALNFFRTVPPGDFGFAKHTSPRAYPAGISFTMRTRLAAVARKRKKQSTFLAPRSFTCRRMLSSLPQPNTFSISLRFF
jgi:hypothetical protein